MTIGPFARHTRRPRAWEPAAAPFVARYEVDAEATGCGVLAAASVDPDLSGWVPVNLDSVSPLGGDRYQLLTAEDAEPLEHGVTIGSIVSGVAGVFTVEVEASQWAGQCDSVGVSSGPCSWWIDLLTGAVHDTTGAFGESLYARVRSDGASGWILRVTGQQATALSSLTLTMLHGGAEFTGAGDDSATLRLVFGGGVKQIRAPQISDSAGSYTLAPPSAGYAPKLYDPHTDAWYGETGYSGGWYGSELEFVSSAALGAMFSGTDVPISVWGDYRPTGDAATTDTVWALAAAVAWHHLRLEVPPNRNAYGRRRDNAAADGSLAERLVATATGVRRVWGDYFNGVARQIYWAGEVSAAAAQDVGACTWSTLAWGGQYSVWPIQGVVNALFVARGGGEDPSIVRSNYHDRRLLEWLAARYPHAIVALPAGPKHGIQTSATISVPAGWYWELTFGTQQIASGRGTGEDVVVEFTPGAAGWQLLRVGLTNAVGVEHGADARLVEVE